MSLYEGGKMLERLFGNGQRWSPQAWEYLWQSLVRLFALGAVFALIIGLVAFSRFELFQRWSEIANRWVSGRRATKDFVQPYYVPDKLIYTRPRLWGVMICVTALYSFVTLLWLVQR